MAGPRPIVGPAVWHGPEQAREGDWLVTLGSSERDELERAAEKVRRSGLALDDVAREDFDLPTLAPTLAAVRREVSWGRGFVLIRGLPVKDYSVDELGAIFWGVGAHLGAGVSQDLAGQRLGRVFDRGVPADRYYNVGGPLVFHVDPADVVGLLCVRAAMEGGASRIVSSFAVHNALLRERPDLLKLLYRGFHVTRRSYGEPPSECPVPMFAEGADGMQCFFLPALYTQAADEGCPLSDLDREAIATVNALASRPELYLDMDFQPGDMQFLNNRTVLHARTDYRDHLDKNRKRLLLRLWLMMSDWAPKAEAMVFTRRSDRAGGGVRPMREADARLS